MESNASKIPVKSKRRKSDELYLLALITKKLMEIQKTYPGTGPKIEEILSSMYHVTCDWPAVPNS